MPQIIRIECQECEEIENYEVESTFVIMRTTDNKVNSTEHNTTIYEALINGIALLEPGEEIDTFLHELPQAIVMLKRKQAGLI
jgi:hypothetical protein